VLSLALSAKDRCIMDSLIWVYRNKPDSSHLHAGGTILKDHIADQDALLIGGRSVRDNRRPDGQTKLYEIAQSRLLKWRTEDANLFFMELPNASKFSWRAC
jgi:hypothetical protein